MDPRGTSDEWQIQEIRAAIKEANSGDFATDADVKTIMDKWNGDVDHAVSQS
jgi:predicted transcriptional regulator